MGGSGEITNNLINLDIIEILLKPPQPLMGLFFKLMFHFYLFYFIINYVLGGSSPYYSQSSCAVVGSKRAFPLYSLKTCCADKETIPVTIIKDMITSNVVFIFENNYLDISLDHTRGSRGLIPAVTWNLLNLNFAYYMIGIKHDLPTRTIQVQNQNNAMNRQLIHLQWELDN